MDRSIVWAIATKDLSVVRKKRSIFYGTTLFPLFISIGLPLVLWLAIERGGRPDEASVPLLKGVIMAFAFWFVIMACIVPGAISSYSIIGEKVEKSLEPLLATPVRDSEILLGKSIAAIIPSLAGIYIGGAIFAAMIDAVTGNIFGYLLLPNLAYAVLLFVLVPGAVASSVELNVFISSRVSDVRTANSLTGIMTLPFGAIYIASVINILNLDLIAMLVISAVMLVVSLALFALTRATFQREEILTKWK